jgi:hypothetical protein
MDFLSSTHLAAPPDMVKDLLKAREKEVAYDEQEEKLEKGIGFYDPIKKMKLKFSPV